jgi:ribosome-binding ATPase YchF (GTP1/OBG family)
MIVEKRIEKIALSNRKGLGTPALKTEEKAMQRILVQLNDNLPIRGLQFDKDEELAIRGYQFLTQKPVLAIVNSSEDNFNKSNAVLEQIAKKCKVVEVAGSFEMELTRLSAEESATFMEDMGIKESARDRLTALAYETLGYISFFTVGEDEVRAWNIRKGQTAVEAAGAIHTDLARGFIAAECFTYNDLMQLGSEKLIKEKGKFKLEGKEYVVKDGDVLNIRFNV